MKTKTSTLVFCGIWTSKSLPEFVSLPSAIFFAECFFRALGKEALCRVPRKKPSVKENTRRRSSLPSVLLLTLGKEFCRRFETGGSLSRRVKCRRVPQPRWVGARPSAKGGSEVAEDGRERGGNPVAFVFVPRPGRVRLQ
jgi:hypothetical protein